MNAKVADLVANAAVVGQPVWTPAVIAALATMFHEARCQASGVREQESDPAKGAGVADPAPVATQEHETWAPPTAAPRSRPT